MKQEFYRLNNLLPHKATYNLLLGERSNGKSYAVKECCLWEAYHEADYNEYINNKQIAKKTRYQIGYLRRWKDEIKTNDVEKYFANMPISEITNGEYSTVICYRNDIYFGNYDENGKAKKGKCIGSCFCLTGATHYKSLTYESIGNVIFEEFLTIDGYIPHEVDNLTSVISTIARRDYIRVFMIGNTINRMCPYFDEWQLTHVKRQQIGTIDIYNQHTDQIDVDGSEVIIKIAVEYCANSGNNTKMFFGNKSKSINTGVWDTNVFPHLDKPMRYYKCKYRLLYCYSTFDFVINLLVGEDKEPFLFIYPSTKTNNKIKRIVSDKFSTNRYVTFYLTPLSEYDKLVIELLDNKKITYSDNLTGTEFEQIKKERGRY